MRLIKEAHNGKSIGFYCKGWDNDRPVILLVPGTLFFAYIPLLLYLWIRGCAISYLFRTDDKALHLNKIYMHLRYDQEIEHIGYVADKDGCAILSSAVLPKEAYKVYMRPPPNTRATTYSSIVHQYLDINGKKVYATMLEPKERISLDFKYGFLIHFLTLSTAILQWLTPIPKSVLTLEEKKD